MPRQVLFAQDDREKKTGSVLLNLVKAHIAFVVFANFQSIAKLLGQIISNGPHCRLRAIVEIQLSQDVLHVLFDSLVADSEAQSNLFVGQTKGNLFKHLTFALR